MYYKMSLEDYDKGKIPLPAMTYEKFLETVKLEDVFDEIIGVARKRSEAGTVSDVFYIMEARIHDKVPNSYILSVDRN